MIISKLIDVFIHLDKYLGGWIIQYGFIVYGLLFLIIFIETGLVIMPFLPGDSLLFAAGSFAAIGSLNIITLLISLSLAAILGDSLNYFLGHKFGRKLFKDESKFLKEIHLIKTENFYEKHGAKTIIIARFVPIVRTFAPFVAGIGKMKYSKFLSYNILGGIAWTFLFLLGGYFFGAIPIVKNNLGLVLIAIILISLIPVAVEWMKNKILKERFKKSKTSGKENENKSPVL